MSKIEVLKTHSPQTKEIFKENEKKEISINIDETTDNVNINKEDENHPVSNDDIALNLEIEDVTGKVKVIKEKYAVREKGRKNKPPAIWVQYNQAHIDQARVFNQDQDGHGPRQQFGGYGYGGNYNSSPLDYDPRSRNYFVKLVFCILLVMLLVTASIVIYIFTNKNLKELYTAAGQIIIIASMVVVVSMNYVIACSACARVPPCNFICLTIVTFAMSNLVAGLTVKFKTDILIHALIVTVIVVAVCILLACSSFDFTKFYIYVVAIAVVFMVITMVISIGMLVMNITYKPLHIFLLFVASLINVVVLIMELQMILGGKAIELSEDDYALGAFLLYTSIVDLFLKIAQMLHLFDEE